MKLGMPLLMVISLSICGCVKRQASQETSAPFRSEPVEACLAIVIDTSGSFAERWDEGAHPIFLKLMDKYFEQSLGQNTKLIIGQISGSTKTHLFEGTPDDFKRRFRSPKKLGDFLRQHADQDGSKVYDSLRLIVDQVRASHGVSPDTRKLVVVFSDLDESEPDKQTWQASGRKMLSSLTRYAEEGGCLALYFVAPEETTLWRKVIDKAGFEEGRYVMESGLVANPQLPEFE